MKNLTLRNNLQVLQISISALNNHLIRQKYCGIMVCDKKSPRVE